jgi:hypothetical protein
MKQSDITPSQSWLLRRFGVDRFDVGIVIALIISFVAVAMLPFAPKKFGDMNFHVEAKTLSLAIQRAGPWTEVAITKAPAPVLYYLIPYLIVLIPSDFVVHSLRPPMEEAMSRLWSQLG